MAVRPKSVAENVYTNNQILLRVATIYTLANKNAYIAGCFGLPHTYDFIICLVHVHVQYVYPDVGQASLWLYS